MKDSEIYFEKKMLHVLPYWNWLKDALVNISIGYFCCGDGLEDSLERRSPRTKSEII